MYKYLNVRYSTLKVLTSSMNIENILKAQGDANLPKEDMTATKDTDICVPIYNNNNQGDCCY